MDRRGFLGMAFGGAMAGTVCKVLPATAADLKRLGDGSGSLACLLDGIIVRDVHWNQPISLQSTVRKIEPLPELRLKAVFTGGYEDLDALATFLHQRIQPGEPEAVPNAFVLEYVASPLDNGDMHFVRLRADGAGG